MAHIQLTHDLTPEGVRFELRARPIIGAAKVIPTARWAEAAPAELLPGVGRLLTWCDDEAAVVRKETAVVVPHVAIAGLDERAARALRLPPACPFVLDLGHDGTLDQPQFRFRASWRRATGQPVAGMRRMGAFLEAGGETYRLPDPLFSLVEGIEAVNATPTEDLDERFRVWGRIQALLPDETQQSIQLDGYLRSTRIAHATRFSLALESGADGFTFSPLLFGPRRVVVEEETDVVPEGETESILPPAQQRVFADKRFPASLDTKARYALGTGWYLVLEEGVRQALSVVRRAQVADREIRRQFARNPRAFLRQALADQFDEEAIDALFVETAEYSQRVEDVGLWQPSVLPWVKRSTEPWLPEIRGLRVGDRNIPVAPPEIAQIREAVQRAIGLGESSVSWHGADIPATEKTLEALAELEAPDDAAGATGEAVAPEPAPPAGDEEPQRQRVVLQIASHFEDVTFRRSLKARRSPIAGGPPAALVTQPKPHQQEGIAWLQQRWREGLPGVLLADDMGLGKTLQALAFLAWLREGMHAGGVPPRPILIVAPTGLLRNWEEEHDRHLAEPGLGQPVRGYGPSLRALRSERSGNELDLGRALIDAERLRSADWILTTYETMRDYQHSFAAVPYAAIVFDEAQRIKTPGTLMTNAAKALNGDFIITMTGTPVENRLADLWCIIDTAVPGLLFDLKSFSREYEADTDPEVQRTKLAALKSRLTEGTEETPPMMLRRLKADQLRGLPIKREHVIPQTMPREQASAYREAVSAARANVAKGAILEALHRLRGISLHPFDPEDADDPAYVDQSARFRAMFPVLDQAKAAGEKVLIFLEDLEMQGYLAALLQRRYRLARPPMLINGGVGGPDRQTRVNAFQASANGFDVMILSPRAGGVGITLTAANHVIHLSRWWNPAVEDQCTDRVYRIGQERPVHVHIPQARHPEFADQSFDCKLHALLDRKRTLSRELLAPPLDPTRDAKELYAGTVGAAMAM